MAEVGEFGPGILQSFKIEKNSNFEEQLLVKYTKSSVNNSQQHSPSERKTKCVICIVSSSSSFIHL